MNPFEDDDSQETRPRRREQRLLAFFPSFYTVDGGRRRSALCIDMSVSGLRLATHTELEVGRSVSVQVFVGDNSGDIWTFEGTVARVEGRQGAKYWPYQAGIKFLTPALDREAWINSLASEFPTVSQT